ncbi:ABC transporter permease [Actinomadura rudentiformis]|uniref:ABC transporter permease n=1 Tax=Actinomadura rudentiformis TaxID=359158 RepID=A0A6H9YGK8_9ACTN|nr:ABC transporter permease [Actinomadura rudentiformis]KAB2344018.1 ABC transporter permease [Actinomadura rudentiformis]
MAVETRRRDADPAIERQITGLDALELGGRTRRSGPRRAWASLWPKLAAIALGVLAWQLVVWSGWKEEYVLPGPDLVFPELWKRIDNGTMAEEVATTMQRALVGFAISVVVGGLIGAAVARVRVLRAAVGSLITGLQTLPSIVWLPFAVLLFNTSETAIMFVVVLGAAPSIAIGLIAGVDYTPPILLRAGKVMGLRGVNRFRHLILPASLPSFVTGLKQGWAFAWRSLMAGELIVNFGKKSLGAQLGTDRDVNDAAGLLATMIVILVIGIVVDMAFGAADRSLRSRWGLNSD